MAEMKPELRSFLQNPKDFDQIVAAYDGDEVSCYLDLRDNAKKSLETFDEYYDFLTYATEYGPTDFVYSRLNRNAVRSIKNMVFGSSRGGRQFPIHSIEELQDRISAYQELNVRGVNQRSVIFTIIEHIYDLDINNRQRYHIINSLLNQSILPQSEIVTTLVRARFLFGIKQSHEMDNQSVEELLADLPDPLSNDGRDGETLLKESNNLSYNDPSKSKFAQAALVRVKNHEALIEFLYLTAQDVPERYRHQSEDTPWRGELLLARTQINILLNAFSEYLSEEQKRRSLSYKKMITGNIESSGRWRSQRDPNKLPDPNFSRAASAYLKAAKEISSVDHERQIKYLSKAFRHQATAARHSGNLPLFGWDVCRSIHENAKEVLTATNQEVGEKHDLEQPLIGLLALHDLLYHRASAVVAFQQEDVKAMEDHIEDMWGMLDTVRVYVDNSLMKDINHLVKGLRSEVGGDYSAAHEEYDDFSHSSINLSQRQVLVYLKQNVQSGEYEDAVRKAKDVFDEDGPIVNALRLMNGNNTSEINAQSPILKNLFGGSLEKKYTFGQIVRLASSDSNNDVLVERLEKLFMEL